MRARNLFLMFGLLAAGTFVAGNLVLSGAAAENPGQKIAEKPGQNPGQNPGDFRGELRLARAPGQCTPESIGLARTVEIDTRGGPRFGENQYPGKGFLQDREVVLTFDDGPHKTLTPAVLEALDFHCTKATFFMVGQRALTYPEMVRTVARRGHTIATHTWTHQDLAKIEPEAALTEIELGISAVQRALGGQAAPFFRYPYLSNPKEMSAHLRERNTAIFSIDIDSLDFKTRSSTAVIRKVMSGLEAKGKGIILFHDIQPSTAGALKTLLSEMKDKGFKIVHVVAKQGQTTLADYDKKVGQKHTGKLASLPVPMSQRGIVSPAWEVQVYRGPTDSRSKTGSNEARSPPPRPRRSDDDWATRLFRGW